MVQTIGFLMKDGPQDPKEALARRAHAGIDRVIARMSDRLAITALAASSDLGAIALLLSNPDLDDPAFEIDPLISLLARSRQHRAEILSECGPMLSATDVGMLLGISRQAVDKRRSAWKLLAVRVGGDWRYPEFQFAGGNVLPGFEALLGAHDSQDPWATLDSILAKDASLDDRSLLDALRDGDTETIELAIRQMQGDGFA